MRNIILKLLVKLGILKSIEPGVAPMYVLAESRKSHPDLGDVRRIKLGLIVGHDNKDKGATFHGNASNEYDYNKEIANMVKQICTGSVIDVAVILRDGIGVVGAYKKAFEEHCDCVVELHCNAFDGKSKGTMTLTSPAAEDVELAQVIQKVLVDSFKSLNRGVVTLSRTDRGAQNVYSYNGMPNCLVEPAFCDNADDSLLLLNNKEMYAQALKDSIVLWARRKNLIA